MMTDDWNNLVSKISPDVEPLDQLDETNKETESIDTSIDTEKLSI